MIKPTVVTVTQLNKYVKSVLDSDRILSGIMVRGEISNFVRHYKSGHLYFSLKDETAAIKSVMFRSYANTLSFQPDNGMSVIVSGSVSLYERDGSYQFYITDIQPDGIGALYLAFEQLKETLSREGLLDPQRKKLLPTYPQRIGVVTSEGAAALQDMLNIISRRYPAVTIMLYPAQVQGNKAVSSLIAGIRAFNSAKSCDVIIIGRGGGSIEDLWAFNNERLAREIAASDIPIVSAVGHETDFTIADFVADLRAPTPSAAAELVVPNMRDLQNYLDNLKHRCFSSLNNHLDQIRLRLTAVQSAMTIPQSMLMRQARELDFLRLTLQKNMEQKLDKSESTVKNLGNLIEERSPIRLLERGYSQTKLSDKTLFSIKQVHPGDQIVTRVSDGKIYSAVVACEEMTK